MSTMVHHDARVLACVDQSHFAEYVADYSAWAAQRLTLPLELLHILDRHQEQGSGDDHSGTIGLSSQDALMDTLVMRDAERTKAARERGRVFLAALRERVRSLGVDDASIRQRYGELEATLLEQEPGVELFVLGRRGESAENTGRDLGRNLERVVRALHRPILAVSEPFSTPQRVMLAYDGSALTRRGIDLMRASPLFHGLECDIVVAGEPGRRDAAQLESARERLAATGLSVTALVLPGDPGSAAVRDRAAIAGDGRVPPATRCRRRTADHALGEGGRCGAPRAPAHDPVASRWTARARRWQGAASRQPRILEATWQGDRRGLGLSGEELRRRLGERPGTFPESRGRLIPNWTREERR